MKNRIDGARIAGRLSVRADRAGEKRIAAIINRAAAKFTPKGLRAEALEDGLRLSGRGLKRRMIADPGIRNWHR